MSNLIDKAREYPGFREWESDYYQFHWDSLQERVQFLSVLLAVSSGILGILSAFQYEISLTLYIRLAYLAPILLLPLGILLGGIALYDLLNMKSRLVKASLKLQIEVLNHKGYHKGRLSVHERKRTRIFEIGSYILFIISIITLTIYKVLTTLQIEFY